MANRELQRGRSRVINSKISSAARQNYRADLISCATAHHFIGNARGASFRLRPLRDGVSTCVVWTGQFNMEKIRILPLRKPRYASDFKHVSPMIWREVQVIGHTFSTPTRLLIWLLFVSCQRLFGQCWGPLMMSTHGSSGRQSLVSIPKVLIETPTALISLHIREAQQCPLY